MNKTSLLNNQKGAALLTVLILLAVIGVIIPPALSLGSSRLKTEKSVESHTTELYAADVGVQQVLWWLKSMNYSNLPTSPATVI